jgi:hypothetical protein
MRPEDRALLQKLRKNQPELLEALKQEFFAEFERRKSIRAKAGLFGKLPESDANVQGEPKKCKTCEYFSEGDDEQGTCTLNENPTKASETCERWKEREEPSSESVRMKMKFLAGVK